ncbi:hypothetical protein ACFZAR_03845 [Streptomyces sp. NPDC008222]|uniref:hypothetical protein n=1 Tax=Streptomyces sp. NPDC008222 TaxID=3364820 RepID=UPI0036F117DB
MQQPSAHGGLGSFERLTVSPDSTIHSGVTGPYRTTGQTAPYRTTGQTGPYRTTGQTGPYRTTGQTAPAQIVVPVVDGKVVLPNNSSSSAHLVADLVGWYGSTMGGPVFRPVSPTRILNTRTGTGGKIAKLGAHATLRLKVTGAHGPPRAQ